MSNSGENTSTEGILRQEEILRQGRLPVGYHTPAGSYTAAIIGQILHGFALPPKEEQAFPISIADAQKG